MKALAATVLTAAVLAGCGGSSSPLQPAGSFLVTMTEFKFTPDTLTVPSGRVVFYLVNGGSNTSHDMVIRDGTGKRIAGSDLVSTGDTSVFTVATIAAGTYTYFCQVPGHRQAGMLGTLIVK